MGSSVRTAGSLLELVGNTPLVELRRLTPKPSVRLYAKLEGQNPTGSIKDRIAVAMIAAAEAAGELEPGRELLEPTSGNTGIALALVAKLKGYSLTCVLPENATEERRRLLRLYGARIVESPGEEGSSGHVHMSCWEGETNAFASEDGTDPLPSVFGSAIAGVVDHLPAASLLLNPTMNSYKRLVPGWFAPINATWGYENRSCAVRAISSGLGTGGTLMGAGERLRASFPEVVVAAAEPLPGDPVMGLRSLDDGYVPPILDVAKLDRKLLVSNEDAVAGVHALLDREGIFAGVSSGAVLHVARRLSDELEEGVVVCVLADGGWKYLSAGFWEGEEIDESKLWW